MNRKFGIFGLIILVAVILGIGAGALKGKTIQPASQFMPIVLRPIGSPQFEAVVYAVGKENRHTDIEPAGNGRLFLVAQNGIIRFIEADGTINDEPFLDISDKVVSSHGEQGLYAITLHPNFAANRTFYAAYTRAGEKPNQWYLVISRFELLPGSSNKADPASEFVLLEIEKNAQNHNGGSLRFGPLDGYLYITVGDDGDPSGAQAGDKLTGKVLRIDVDTAVPYAIPPDNPYVNDPAVRDEIWAVGLRNPWRLRFDDVSGDMYIGDVGESTWEEINFEPGVSAGGQNYGWPCFEGQEVYDQPICDANITYAMPAHVYRHENGRCSITGGDIYTGQLFPAWQNKYLFGDFCSGEVFALRFNATGNWQTEWLGEIPWLIATFGQDETGEVYVGSFNSKNIYKLTPLQ